MSITRVLPIFALAAILGAPLAAGAQTLASPAPLAPAAPMMSGHHHRHHHQSLMHALQSLNLTDAQKQQVATFHSQQQQANLHADPATKRANAAKMRDQVMGVLTPDQKTQLQSEMHHHGSAMNSSGSMAPNPAPAASPNSH